MNHWLLSIFTVIFASILSLNFLFLPVLNLYFLTSSIFDLKHKAQKIVLENRHNLNAIPGTLLSLNSAKISITGVNQRIINNAFQVYEISFQPRNLFYNQFIKKSEIESKTYKINAVIDRDPFYDQG